MVRKYLLATLILNIPIMFVVYEKPYMVSNRLLVPGTKDLVSTSLPSVSRVVDLTILYLPFIIARTPYIFCYTWMILSSPPPIHLFSQESYLVSPLSFL